MPKVKPIHRMSLFKDEIDFSRAIIEMTQQIILLLDDEGAIMDCNVHMENLSGYPVEKLKGLKWRELMVSLDGSAFPKGYFQSTIVRKSAPRTEVYRLDTRSGERLYLEFNFRVQKDNDGQFNGVLVVGYDVTERVIHELSLEEERFDLIERNKELSCLYQVANLANDDIIGLDELLQSTSELIPDAMQYPETAAAMIRLDHKSYTTPGFSASDHCIKEPIVIQGEERGRLEIVYSDPSEDAPEGLVPFLDEERHLAHAVARHLSLIVDKREANEKKLELEQQLRHTERLATIGQLAAGIAHELNNPLGDILGFAQLASNHPDLPEQTYQDLFKIVKSTLYAREVIKKILLFSRQSHPHEGKVNLNQLIDDWLDFFHFRCQQNSIEIILELDRQLPTISGDPSQINQVIINLVVNAIHAMPDGGKLTIQTGIENEWIYLKIQDSGTGIDENIRDKIFLPFFTTKEVDQGTGLGLSVVYGIVQEHGGNITLESLIGEGTTFKIEFMKSIQQR